MLIGFCILGEGREPDPRRYFPEEVSCTKRKIGSSTLFLFGYGPEYEKPIEEKTYSLYGDGLSHRNIQVRISPDCVEFVADWLGSFPCYYDEVKMNIASHWGMLDLQARECDPIGSYTLKRYSFIPTSRTVKNGVKRLLGDQRLIWRPGQIECESIESNLSLKYLTRTEDVVQSIVVRLKKDGLETSNTIIPLSGGYDSRFLATIVNFEFRRPFKSFTYSLLGARGDCFESKVSKVVAHRLGSQWRSFDLTGYARYEQSILDWTGGFSHVNGDYYEMFAEQVLKDGTYDKDTLIISGIVGDAWCGKVKTTNVLKGQAANVLYSHGISTYGWLINSEEEKLSSQAEDELNQFFCTRIHSDETFLYELVKAKVALLSFLCYSFERRGVRCSAPFLDKSVVESILSLDRQQRQNRKWQKEYFENLGLSDSQLPSVLLKINRLAIDEGMKKHCYSFIGLKLPAAKLIFLKILLSEPVRQVERIFTSYKITEYILRKTGYKRSDVLISILNVLTK